jgi:23S rRNA (cytosine1962-C5)-methyltransferase
MTYALVDSGNGRKLERFGPFLIARPASQALWLPTLPPEVWEQADATLIREGEKQWIKRSTLPLQWQVTLSDIQFLIRLTDFGHLGLFPEQRNFWHWIAEQRPASVLNLFAYSGGSTLAATKAGAQVCHLDASKGMVAWAKENAALNGLEKAPIRWIVDDVTKFLAREKRRGNRYDAIVLDPPTFGRGSQGEVFKIEEQIVPLLRSCRELLSDRPQFVLLTCHTPGITPTVLTHLLSQVLQGCGGHVEAGEMTLTGASDVLSLPSGAYARWRC